ncbi:MAG: hypothetical protein Kow00124_14880 [Anaerolineae bacterium]
MATPYDGKIGLWHFKGDVLGERSLEELVTTLKTWAPAADAVWVKTTDGTNWEGRWDTSTMAINGPADIERWVSVLGRSGLEFHAWAVVKGVNIAGEIDILARTAQVPGVKSLILDVEPYDYFWEGTEQDVHRLMQGLRSRIGPDFHIGMSVDPRSHHYNSIFPDAWRPYVNSVHPQCYWQTMQRTPESILTETYLVWGNYGLPIYPVLQGAATPESIRQAQRIARSVRGAGGLSYWRLGAIGPRQFPVINEEFVDSEVGPDGVLRRYDWERTISADEAGYFDGTHTGQPSDQVFKSFMGVRGHPIKYVQTQPTNDRVWAMWVGNLPTKGLYEISVFVPGQHATTREARYHIHGISGVGSELLVRLNQLRYKNEWVPLVVYEFEKGGGQVNLTDLTGEAGREVAFGGIRWRRVIEQIMPSQVMGFDSPVGTAEERLSAMVWPGTWFDATGFAQFYTTVGPAYHTGADLNNNKPVHDTDRDAPVYAAGDGTVTFSALGGGTWGHIIVIRHTPLPDGTVVWTRYAHVHNPMVRAGERVERGQQIATVGNANGRLQAYHLHFDVAITDVLEQNPAHWPGNNLAEVLRHYTDPRAFIEAHRPPGRG